MLSSRGRSLGIMVQRLGSTLVLSLPWNLVVLQRALARPCVARARPSRPQCSSFSGELDVAAWQAFTSLAWPFTPGTACRTCAVQHKPGASLRPHAPCFPSRHRQNSVTGRSGTESHSFVKLGALALTRAQKLWQWQWQRRRQW